MKIYTTEAAAELLSVNEYTIRRWAREGKLSGSRIGKEWRFTEADIHRFLEDHRPPRKQDVEPRR